jgi:hypothetical protein
MTGLRAVSPQRLSKMLPDRLEDGPAHDLVCFLSADPSDFSQFVRVTDKGVNSVRRPGCDVHHRPSSLRVNTSADHAASADAEPCLFLDLAHSSVSRRLAGLDLPRDECPRWHPVCPLADEHTRVTGDDSGYDGLGFRCARRLTHDVLLLGSLRGPSPDDLVCESLADSEAVGELAEGQTFGIVGKQHLCVLDGGSSLGQLPHLPRQPLCRIRSIKRPAHRSDALQGRPPRCNCGLDSAVNVTHATSVQAVSVTPTDSFVHSLDDSVHAMYVH